MKDEPQVMEGKVGGSGPRPELVYSLARLLELKGHPLAQIWPPYLDPAYKNNRGVWDPDRWHLDQKRSETPAGERLKEVERLKDRPNSILGDAGKSDEALILSPQRGSFLSGCQAVKDELNLRPDQPSGGTRRVGSGRILRNDKDEYQPNRGTRTRGDKENPRGEWGDRQFSKYGFARDEDDRRSGWDGGSFQEERGGGERRRGRGSGALAPGGGRRPHQRSSENEPEWMNETVTLTDIIELKGFEEAKGRNSRPNSRQSNKSGGQAQPTGGQGQRPPAGGAPHAQQDNNKDDFNFDQIMESVNLSSLLGCSIGPGDQPVEGGKPPATQSRFSQFFNKPRSRRSSIQDELLGNNILREINGEPVIKIPSPEESNKYFTPISPAAKTGQGSNSLLDMLQKGQPGKKEDSSMVQKLEDGLKRQLGLEKPAPPPQPPASHQQKQNQDNDLSAFKKLVAQVKSHPGGERPPMFGFVAPGLVRPTPIPSLPPNVMTEQEILEGRAMAAQRINIQQIIPPQLLQFLEHYQLNPEVLKRAETEHLIRCINSGACPIETIIEQLSNPALNPRQRELILTVLKLRTLGHTFPPPFQGLMAAPQMMSRASPHDHLLSQPPPAHSRVSPLMFAGMGNSHLAVSPGPQNQRVPSPQEMTVLTQQILQQALIKKKLEEQKENYRKKHEGKMDREDKENIRGIKAADHASAGSPLAFTPTSVMRKSAADRKDSDPKPGVPELKITGQEDNRPGPHSPGRPIKGKGADRPGSLDLAAGRNLKNGGGGRGSLPQAQQPQHGLISGATAAGGVPNNNNLVGVNQNLHNPLLFLTNPGIPAAMMGAGGMAGFGPGGAAGNLAGMIGAGGARFQQHPGMHAPNGTGHPGMRVGGPPSPRGHQTPVSPAAGATPLSRFFSNDVLAAAAAAQGAARLKMPPLPTGQAMTLEEIERQAATVKI